MPRNSHPPPACVGVIVPAAGIGRRLGDQGPKALVELAGRPLLAHVLDRLAAAACVGAVTVATHPAAHAAVAQLTSQVLGAARPGLPHTVVTGGGTRQASVAAALAALPTDLPWVAVHDAARPLVTPGLLADLLARLRAAPAAAGAVPCRSVTDTVRRVGVTGDSAGVVDREDLCQVQTPQLFTRTALVDAHELAIRDRVEATDDAALVEHAGGRILLVPGPADNLKVTTPDDLRLAALLLGETPTSSCS